MKSFILSVLSVFLPSSLSAAERIGIDFKILAEKIEDIEILTLPSVSTETDQEIESVIFSELLPDSVIKQGFTPTRIGTQLAVTPSHVDGKIAFTAIITISKLVDKKWQGNRFQTEIQSHVVCLSASQKSGQGGWFDLVDLEPGKDKKVTALIRLKNLPDEAERK